MHLATGKMVGLLLINAILLVAGCFMDAISIFYVFLPILLPVVNALGIDLVHFGVVMTVNMAIGQITPPVGVNLFVACRHRPHFHEGDLPGRPPDGRRPDRGAPRDQFLADLSLFLTRFMR